MKKISYDTLAKNIIERVDACKIGFAEEGSPVITWEDYVRIKNEIYENANSALKKGFRIKDEPSPVSWSKYLCTSIGTYRINVRVMVKK